MTPDQELHYPRGSVGNSDAVPFSTFDLQSTCHTGRATKKDSKVAALSASSIHKICDIMPVLDTLQYAADHIMSCCLRGRDKFPSNRFYCGAKNFRAMIISRHDLF